MPYAEIRQYKYYALMSPLPKAQYHNMNHIEMHLIQLLWSRLTLEI